MAESNSSNPTLASSSGDAAADSTHTPALSSSSTLSLSHDVFSVKLSSSWTSSYMCDEDGDGDSQEGDNHSGAARAGFARFNSNGNASRRTTRSRSPLNGENCPPSGSRGLNRGGGGGGPSDKSRRKNVQKSLSGRKPSLSQKKSSLKPRFPVGDKSPSRSARKSSRSPRARAAARSPTSKSPLPNVSENSTKEKQTHKRPREENPATAAATGGGKTDVDTAPWSSSSTPMVTPKKGTAGGRKCAAPPPIELPANADGEGDFGDEFATPMYLGSTSEATPNAGSSTPMEMTDRRIAQRQKQIDLGKATIGYKNYLTRVSKESRRGDKRNSAHPVTPDVHQNCSKRKFDGLVSRWRRRLHLYDVDVDDTEFERRVAAEEALHTPRKAPPVHATPVGKRRKKGEHSPADALVVPVAADSDKPLTASAARLTQGHLHAVPTDEAYAEDFPACEPTEDAASGKKFTAVATSTAGGAASFYEALTKQPARPPPSNADDRSSANMSDVNDAESVARRQLNYDSAISEFGGGDTMSVTSSSAFSSATGGTLSTNSAAGASRGTSGGAPAVAWPNTVSSIVSAPAAVWPNIAGNTPAASAPSTFTFHAAGGGVVAPGTGFANAGGGLDAPRTMAVSNNDSVMSSFELNLNDPDEDEDADASAGAATGASDANADSSSASNVSAAHRDRLPSFAEILGGLSSPTLRASPMTAAAADTSGKAKKEMSLAQSGNTPPPPKSKTPKKLSYVSALSAKK